MSEKDIQEKIARLSPEKRELLLKKLQQSNQGKPVKTLKNITKNHNKGFVELSYAQQRLWFLNELEGPNAAYNMPALFRVKGNIDVRALRLSIEDIVKRHEMMRTVFTEIEGIAYQKVISPFEYPIVIDDISGQSKQEQAQLCEKIIAKSLMTTFDLSKAPLFMLKLVKLTGNEAILIINMHHIISDGWSTGVLVRELTALYNGYCTGKPVRLAELEVQYSDYSHWQREFLAGNSYKSKISFWTEYLRDAPALELPLDKPRPVVQSMRGARESFILDQSDTAQLKKISDQYETTLFNSLLTAYLVLLYRYTGQEDITVGVPVANRNRKEIELLIGFFVNTVTLRQNLSGSAVFSELLKNVQSNVLKVFDHQDIPFEKLVDELGVARDMSQSPLFQTMFSYQEQQIDSFKMSNVEFDYLPTNMPIAKFDITLSLINYGDRLEGEIEYNTDLFETSTIKKMLQHYKNIINGVLANPQNKISKIPMLAQDDWQWLEGVNQKPVDYKNNLTIHQWVEAQTKKTPDNIAVIHGKENISYRQLNEKANQLARYLHQQNQGKNQTENTLIGICLDRSVDLIVSILAVLKAGAAYVPLDPSYPKQRLEFMISDSGMPMVLSKKGIMTASNSKAALIELDLKEKDIAKASTENLDLKINLEQLLYVIYTSGSTGTPKCTGATHKAENNLLHWYANEFNLNEQDRVLLLSAMGFDLTQKNIFAPLIKGAALVIPEGQYFELDELLKLISKTKTTWLNCAPSAFYPLADNAQNFNALKSLRYVFLGGEPIKHQRLRLWHEQSNCQLINSYGPTECTDIASYHCLTKKDWRSDRSVPIGKSIPNVQLYVLDRDAEFVPPGVVGELYIGGTSVGPGYLKDQALTAEKFINHPEVLKLNNISQTIYKTGDRVRFKKDGSLDYLGRADNQVKLRGYRIELGEIESQLNELSTISESAVIVKKDLQGNPGLVAFIVMDEDSTLKKRIEEKNTVAKNIDAIKRALKERLPDYMVPNQFAILKSLPLTANGKVDHKSLQALELLNDEEINKNIILPKTDKEKCLVKIWAEVLGRNQIGIEDNFFDLGGDSILSIQIVSRARRAGLDITARQIFENQTIVELAEVVKWGGANTLAEQGPVAGASLLNPVQQWFFEEPVVDADHWNQSVLLRLDDRISIDHISQAVKALIAQHDALRLSFENKNGKVTEAIHQAANIDNVLHSFNIEDKQELNNAIEKTQRSLSLNKGPLMAVAYIKVNGNNKIENRTKLFIAIHHLVVDGVSWRILLEDLNLALQQSMNNSAIDLGVKTSSFKEYVQVLNEYSQSKISDNTRAYWQKFATQKFPELPFQNPKGSKLVSDTIKLSTKLSNEKTSQLLADANKAYRTDINDLLLAALALAVSEWTNSNEVLISLEGHGREDFSENIDLSRTVGWFTTLFPLLLSVPQGQEIGSVIKAIKEQKKAVPNNGFEYGLLRYPNNNTNNKALADSLAKICPQIVFNYLGQFNLDENSNQNFSVSKLDFSHTNLSPQGERKHTIEINGGITNGHLELFWSFSDKQLSKEVIQELAEKFALQLEKIIDHCQLETSYGLTPSDFPLCKLSQTEVDSLIENQSKYFGKKNILDAYPLSPLQEGMLFHALHEQGTGLYCEQVKLDIKEALDLQIIKQAWQLAIDKHAILRTAFVWDEIPQPLQCVHERVTVSFNEYTADKSRFNHFLNEELKKGFDLTKPGLIKVYICKNNSDDFSLAVLFHHIILDGWSLSLVLADVFKNYKELIDGHRVIANEKYGQNSNLAGKYDYRSFIKFLNNVNKEKKEAEENFWKKYLADINDLAELPNDYYCERASSAERDALSINVDATLSKKITAGVKEKRITTNVFFQGVWALLLSRYSSVKDVVFGITLSGRPPELPKSEEIVGLFINTLPLRIKVDDFGKKTVEEYFAALQKQQLELRKYETTGLNTIYKWLNYDKGSELFESLFVFENYPVDHALQEGASDLSIGSVSTQWQTNYPLSLVINPGENIEIKISYDKKRYSREFISDMLENFIHTSEVLTESYTSPLDELLLLSNDEQKKILADWNATKSPYEDSASIAELFEQQVRATPKNTAIRFKQHSYTYEEINSHANQLAEKISQTRYANTKHSRDQLLVALCAERSVEMIVAMLAIVKAGAAYVPLDANYPVERLQYMLNDTGAKLLLLQNAFNAHFADFDIEKICLEEDVSAFACENKQPKSNSNSLAYVMYTSGSTGKPKGIEICQKSIARLVRNTNYIDLNEDQVFLQYAPISFDAATLEIWGPLLNGGTLVVAPPGHLEMDQLADTLIQENINTVWLTAALFHYLAEYHLEAFVKIKQLLAGGDVLSPTLVRKVLDAYPGIKIINGYGPTENTTFTCCYPMTNAAQVAKSVSIGRPIANTQVYVLDKQLKPVSMGMPGELYTAGDGVARGYLNKPELTEKAFLANPYAMEYDHGKVLYKTGDLARYLPDGNIEYLGRIDQQVKIRGYRIELGEIENILKNIEPIREVAVIAREGKAGIKKLLAYLVVKDGCQAIGNEKLKQALKAELPGYMIPSNFIWLEKLPITENGKLDRKALPAPDIEVSRNRQHVGPRNENEKILQNVWADVLGIENIGVHDNYFELGGDSILSIQIVSRVKKAGLKINSRQLFELQTIAALAEQAETCQTVKAEQGFVTKAAKLTPIQQWFFEQRFEHQNQWNMSVLLKLNLDSNQPPNNLKGFSALKNVLNTATEELIKQHDILRSVFKISEYGAVHGYVEADFSSAPLNQVFKAYEINQLEELQQLISTIQRSLDLEKGPLFKIALIKIQNEYRVFISAHHLIIDGVSWRILLEDFNTLLLQLNKNDSLGIGNESLNNLLGEKTTSFSEWSHELFNYADSKPVLAQLEYWDALPFDKVKPLFTNQSLENSVESTVVIEETLSVEKTKQLLLEAGKAYRTEINDLLITALAITLNEWQQQQYCLINLEGHGREHISDAVDVSRTIGWFTTSFPVLLQLESFSEGRIDYAGTIKSVKEQLRLIPEKGLSYGLLRYHGSDSAAKTLAEKPQAEINFNYLGQTDNTFNKQSILLPANEAAGHDRHLKNHQTHLLDIFGIVLNEKLTIGWRFGNNIFERQTIEKLIKRHKQILENIIEFCLADENGGFTPSDFPLANLDQQSLDTIVKQYPDIEDLYPLSAMQQGMLFHARLEPETGVYFEQHIVELKGKLDREVFKLAWTSVIKQHEILRTSFIWEGLDQSLQVVHKHCDINIDYIKHKIDFKEFLKQDRIKGFDFKEAPLMRISLISTDENVQKMVWSFHHILLDGWSVARVIADVFSAYEMMLQGSIPEPVQVPKYGNYISWLQSNDKNLAREFWTRYLAGFESITPLGMRSMVSLQTQGNGEAKPIKDFIFEQSLKAEIENFCKEHRFTSNTLFQAVWAYLLASYSGMQDVVYGITVSGRPPELQGVEDMVGLFINTIPLRILLEDEQSIIEWLQEIQQKQTEARTFESTPLYEVQQCSEVIAEGHLFESLLVFENYPVNDVLKASSISVEFSNISSVEQTNFPLTIVIMPGEILKMRIAYEASSFTEIAIERLFRQFTQVLKNIVTKPYSALKDLTVINAEEFNKVVYEWNKTFVSSDLDSSVIQEFEARVRQHPEKKAVTDHRLEYTFAALNKKANKIARYLHENGVSKGDFVAILSKRSVDMVAAIIGIVKTGAAYIPIDPSYPEGRVNLILKDAMVKALITETAWQEKLTDFNNAILNLTVSAAQLEGFSENNLETSIDKNDFVYSIYTSGSTGTPKGVLIQHKALKNLCNWHNRNFEINATDNLSLIASEGFDASVWEMWPGLIKGACINIAHNDIRVDPEALGKWLNEKNINVSFLPTPIAENMLKNNIEFPECFRALLTGGDQLTIWPEKNLGFKVYNQYGPTEASVVTTSVELNDLHCVGLPPIGKPIDNYKIYVLDRHLSPRPIGMPGELHIGGEGLAWGYLNQPELTAEKFIHNPFSENAEERLYKTGDLVRYEENGNLKFMGRINHNFGSDISMTSNQVKIRGFRIELGEIEGVLSSQGQVNTAIVRAIEHNGQKYLAAYVVPEKNIQQDVVTLPEKLQLTLEEFLPDYMIPSAIVIIKAVPLTSNGKIDYSQLPAINFQQIKLIDYVAPRTAVEAKLVDIWQSVLGVDRVGIYDNFFELGGHSILITKVNTRIKEVFGTNLPLKSLFEVTTVAAVAELIETINWQTESEDALADENDFDEGTL